MLAAFRFILAFALLAVACTTAAQTTRVRGTIERVDGSDLTVRTTEGTERKLTITGNAVIVAVLKSSLSEIKDGTVLGSAALPQPDGTQKALEVHIFPESMRGTGEGHRPYAPVPQGTMTNGTATGGTVTGVDGSTMIVKYKEGQQKIVISPNTPIVRYEVGSVSDLKPGAHFTVNAATARPDGSLEANRINVGRDGVVPQ
jgi:hypothetical protein